MYVCICVYIYIYKYIYIYTYVVLLSLSSFSLVLLCVLLSLVLSLLRICLVVILQRSVYFKGVFFSRLNCIHPYISLSMGVNKDYIVYFKECIIYLYQDFQRSVYFTGTGMIWCLVCCACCAYGVWSVVRIEAASKARGI